jgi:hypothetical protein
VTGLANRMGQEAGAQGAAESFGLHAGVLGPIETLAQSVSTIAPPTSPSMIIPLVFAMAGNATRCQKNRFHVNPARVSSQPQIVIPMRTIPICSFTPKKSWNFRRV